MKNGRTSHAGFGILNPSLLEVEVGLCSRGVQLAYLACTIPMA